LKRAAELSRSGILTVILPTEGRPTFGYQIEKEVRSPSGEQADLLLAWSKTMQGVFDRCRQPVARTCVVTGPNRFDFYRAPLTSALMTREQMLRRVDTTHEGPIVSWATAFPSAKFWEKNLEWQVNDWKQYGYEEFGATDNEKVSLIRSEYEAREQSMAALEQCASSLDGANFIIKAHPFEDVTYYERRIQAWQAAGLRNISFVKGIYIWDLLNACAVHVHRLCTTGTEAWLLGKPTIDLNFIKLHWEKFEEGAEQKGAGFDAHEAEDLAESPQEVIEKLRAYLDGAAVSDELLRKRDAYVHKWFHTVDGHATDRVVQAIENAVDQRKPEQLSFWRRKALTARVKIRIKQLLRLPFDEWWRRPGRPIESEYDAIGHWDRVICQRDVMEWEKRLRPLLRVCDCR